jgi:hypothetical protein
MSLAPTMSRTRSVEGKGGSVRAVTVSVAALGLFFLAVAEPTGSIAGIVYDAATRTPLAGASVVVLNTELGAAGDADGRFLVTDIPAGTYSVEASMIGYESQVKTIVVVDPARTTELVFRLGQSRIQLAEVTVKAEYFPKVKDAPVSERNFSAAEVEVAPGGLGDIQRVVQAMPSVVSSGDQDNEVIVRGGNPNENLFMVDGIEVPYPNHFGSFTAQGGPINMLNPILVREVDFVAGAFPAKYGNRASSVMDISLKRGSLRQLDGSIDMGMGGLGAVLEFPLPGQGNSFIGSYHKSFLELMAEMGVWGGMSAVPYYDNALGKATLRLARGHDLSVLGMWGADHIEIEPYANVDSNDYTAKQTTSRYAGGIGWQMLFGDRGYGRLLLSGNNTSWDALAHESTDVGDTIQYARSSIGGLQARYDAAFRLAPGHETQGGLTVGRSPSDFSFFTKPDTVYRYDYDTSNVVVDSFPVLDSAGNPVVWKMQGYGNAASLNLGAYLQHRFALDGLGHLTAGGRVDHFGYSGATSIAPRVGFSSRPLVANTRINAGWGWHFQPPDWFTFFSDSAANQELRDRRSDHYIVGLERPFGTDVKLSLEGFIKRNHFLPISFAATTPDTYDSPDRYVAWGEGGAEGLELFLQKKHSANWHGSLAYSLSRSWEVAPQDSTVRFAGDYDYGHIVTASGTYTAEFHRQEWYRDLPGWFRATIGGFFLSDEMGLGARLRYMGGRPFTAPAWNPGIRRWVATTEGLNSERYPAYSRLDVRWDHKFILRNWSISWYFEVQNVLNRENVWMYLYNDGNPERETVSGMGFFPMAGLFVEF